MTKGKNSGRRSAAAAPKRRKKRRGRNTLYYLLFGMIVLLAASAIYFSLFYKVTKLEIQGKSRYTNEEILSLSGLQIGQSLFDVDRRQIAETLLAALPYLGDVTVTQTFPTGICIRVEEVKVMGAFDVGKGYVLVSDTGRVVETNLHTPDGGVPIIKGVSVTSEQAGTYLDSTEQEKLRTLAVLLAAIQESGFDTITYIDVSDPLNLKLLYDKRIFVELGTETELVNKLRFSKRMLEEQIGSEIRGTLNATNHKRLSLLESAQ